MRNEFSLLLIQGGTVYAPEPLREVDVLVVGGKIAHVGKIDRRAIESLPLPLEVIPARGHVVTPGFIDPHEHLLGGSGEEGFSSQTPEIRIAELLPGGITTVVGCLGVDTTMKNLPSLLARVKALLEEGISAFMWTGSYSIPPATITGSLRNDILFIDEIIGAGEIALSDERAMEGSPREVARIVRDTYVAGRLSRKAGVTHFHIGNGEKRLALLRTLIEEFDVRPEWLYPTHIQRSEKLMDEAIDLARRGAMVDIDVVDRDLYKWLRYFRENDGPIGRLTVSTDASISSPRYLLDQIRRCIRDHQLPIEEVLPLVTTNTAHFLKLRQKGRLEVGFDGDVLIFEEDSFELVEVIVAGQRRIKEGTLLIKEKALRSDRDIIVGR